MADRGDTHYRVGTLNVWFAVSSVLLLISSVWMMVDDWNAPYPALNYWIEKVDFNQREYGKFKTSVIVRRESSRSVTEPVTVRMKTIAGADVQNHIFARQMRGQAGTVI